MPEPDPFAFARISAWIVVFMDSHGWPLHWWDRLFTRRGFRHVMLYGCQGSDRIVLLDPNAEITDVAVFDRTVAARRLREHVARGDRMVAVDAVHRPVPHLPGIFTCVTVAKHVLGLRCWAQTPWQLYRRLTTEG